MQHRLGVAYWFDIGIIDYVSGASPFPLSAGGGGGGGGAVDADVVGGAVEGEVAGGSGVVDCVDADVLEPLVADGVVLVLPDALLPVPEPVPLLVVVVEVPEVVDVDFVVLESEPCT